MLSDGPGIECSFATNPGVSASVSDLSAVWLFTLLDVTRTHSYITYFMEVEMVTYIT